VEYDNENKLLDSSGCNPSFFIDVLNIEFLNAVRVEEQRCGEVEGDSVFA